MVENDEEVFQNHLSTMKYVRGEENNVLGLYLGNNSNIISHMMLLQNKPQFTIIGGYIFYKR